MVLRFSHLSFLRICIIRIAGIVFVARYPITGCTGDAANLWGNACSRKIISGGLLPDAEFDPTVLASLVDGDEPALEMR